MEAYSLLAQFYDDIDTIQYNGVKNEKFPIIIEGIVHDIDGIVEIVVWTNDRILFKTKKNLRRIYVYSLY